MDNKFLSRTGNAEICLALLGSILIRWCVSLGSYSGQGKPPMYGDYEAQRHWQEITTNLPVSEWYTNSSQNDLLYWGLDYPPLTAYHSWICGYVASKINSEWTALKSSRGIESYHHKLFMRYTVLIIDILIFFPIAILLYWNNLKKKWVSFLLLIYLLFYPGLILIDHGHFQYNNFSLGLFLWSVFAFSNEFYLMGSVFFCLALNYKQMELYHALPVFFFLLGKSFSKDIFYCVKMIGNLAAVVTLCFIVLWAPYIYSLDSVFQVLNRLFPVNRGLYEDKVANFWCAISPIIKLKQIIPQSRLVQLSAASTLLLSLPSCIHLMKKPTLRIFKYSLVNVSLIFFLFSYQVHEKSILIPAISSCLLVDEVPSVLITWFLHFTVLSMSPLLLKDGLVLQQLSTSLLFLVLISFLDIGEKSSKFFSSIFWSSIFFSASLVFLPILIDPPAKYPDLWTVVLSSICCAVFLLFSALFYYLQFKNPNPKSEKFKKS